MVPALWLSGPSRHRRTECPLPAHGEQGPLRVIPEAQPGTCVLAHGQLASIYGKRQRLLLPREVRDPLNQVFIGSQSSWDRTLCNTFKYVERIF